MRHFDADDVVAAAPVGRLLDAVEAAFRDVEAGRDRSPLRTHVPLPNGDLLLMPGIREGGRGSTVKIVTVIPDNAARGLPTVQATVVWIDGGTGEPAAILDGGTLTRMRTGAASGVATRLMARTDASVLAMIGAGGQAAWQVRAVVAARPIRRVLVFSRTADGRDRLARELGDELGPEISVDAVASARDAVRAADVICCATTSSEPVFDAAWIRPGTHVNGVGAFRLGMVELPPELFGAASLVAVDSREAAAAEAGDLAEAVQLQRISMSDVVQLGSIATNWAARRPSDAITVFKSVGLAIQDVAAAELVVGG